MNEPSKFIPSEEVHLLHTKLCRVVGDPKRIQILYALADSPCSVGMLADLLASPQPTISRHLAILRESGLVNGQRSGTTITYRLAVPEMIDVIESMRGILRTVIAKQANSLEDDLTPE